MVKLDEAERLKWNAKKKRFYAKNSRRCAVCGLRHGQRVSRSSSYYKSLSPRKSKTKRAVNLKVKVDLHHKTYKYGYGDVPLEYLVPLCRQHHNALHKSYELKRKKNHLLSLLDHTNNFIATERSKR